MLWREVVRSDSAQLIVRYLVIAIHKPLGDATGAHNYNSLTHRPLDGFDIIFGHIAIANSSNNNATRPAIYSSIDRIASTAGVSMQNINSR